MMIEQMGWVEGITDGYVLFFFLNFIILIYLLLKNRSLRNHLYELIKNTHNIIRISVLLVMLFQLSNLFYSMEPLNNLYPVNLQEIYQANELYTKYRFSELTRPYGFSIITAGVKFLTGADYIYIKSGLGIFFSLLTIFMLFILIKHLTNNDIISLFATLLYVSIGDVVFYTSTSVDSIAPSFFLILFIISLYCVNSPKIKTSRLILFTSLFIVYFRIETVVFLIIFALYFMIKKLYLRFHLADYLISFILFLPHTVYLANYKYFINYQPIPPVSLANANIRIISSFNLFMDIFPLPFLVLVFVGLFYCIKNKKWFLPAMLIALYGVYITNDVYSYFWKRYFFHLLPFIITMVSLGAYYTISFDKSKIWKYSWISVIGLLLIFNTDHRLFSKFDIDYHHVEPHIITGEELKNNRIILHGQDFNIFNYKRFYYNYTFIHEVSNPYDFDYIVTISENNEETYWLMKDLDINTTFIKNDGVVYLYKINK